LGRPKTKVSKVAWTFIKKEMEGNKKVEEKIGTLEGRKKMEGGKALHEVSSASPLSHPAKGHFGLYRFSHRKGAMENGVERVMCEGVLDNFCLCDPGTVQARPCPYQRKKRRKRSS
jgi:hypothetical protein